VGAGAAAAVSGLTQEAMVAAYLRLYAELAR